jgi:integrase
MWDGVSNQVVNTTKGRKDHTIPMNSLLKQELGVIRNNSKGSFIFSDVETRPIDPSNFRRRMWNKDLANAGIRRIRIHDSRHTYSSLFVMNGGSLYDLKKILDHADFKTTERYAHLSNDYLSGVKNIIKPKIDNYAEVISVDKRVIKNCSPSIHPAEQNALVSNF